jgi:formylglycine-generating enzyme required for sulfatase activity
VAHVPPVGANPQAAPVVPPVLVVAGPLAGEAQRLEDLQRQRDLAWRERVVRPIDGAPMVRVEGTRFTMGDAHGVANESPEHEVDVETFWIDQFEVSLGQGMRYNDATEESGHARIRIDGDQSDLPLADVSWSEAAIYCDWVGGSLPTEAQWELAARAVDGRDWPWGSEFRGECVNADLEIGAQREPMSVDSLECGAGLGGIRHLLGNVAEWTLDSYGLYARDPLEEGGASWSVRKVVRGGSFLTRDPRALTTHAREGERPGSRRPDLGLRCVLTHEP